MVSTGEGNSQRLRAEDACKRKEVVPCGGYFFIIILTSGVLPEVTSDFSFLAGAVQAGGALRQQLPYPPAHQG